MEKRKSMNQPLNPNWVTGFLEAEGCFQVSFTKRVYRKVKIEVRPSFSTCQVPSSRQILEEFQHFFRCGAIRYSRKDGVYRYEVRSVVDLVTKVIPHFSDYPFVGKKQDDFERFKKICGLVHSNHNQTNAQLRVILEIAYGMNSPGKRKVSKEVLLKLIVS